MDMDRDISRRHMLALSAAAGGLAFDGGISRAFAQASTRIEQLAPELDKIIATSEPIKELATGFGGPLGPAEGPLWWKEGGYPAVQRHSQQPPDEVHAGAGATVVLEPTNRANGLTRDLQGRLLACEHDTRRVTRRELDGSLTVIANSFQGRRLNRPNDVVVKSDGAIYFTDPWTSPAAPEQWDLTFSGVYRLTPDLGTLTLLVDDFVAAQRARVLARRERALHQRHPPRPYPRLRHRCPTARSPGRATGCSPICAAASPACPTA